MDAHHNGTVPGLPVPDRLQDNDPDDLVPLGADDHAASVTPRSATPAGGPAPQGDHESKQRDCADGGASRKLISTAAARAALLGIEVLPLPGGAWHLRHARGADIGIVRGLQSLVAAVAGFEAARHDVQEMIQHMRRST